MARRWSSRGASFHKKNKPSKRFSCEWLEPRTLFVVLHGGDVFEFFAENSFYERVAVTGNTTVELVGARVNNDPMDMLPPFALNPMQGVLDGMPVNGGFVNMPPMGMTAPNVNDTIFSMYVSQSDVNSRISVAMVPDLMTSPRPMQPFASSIGTLRVVPTGISAGRPNFPMFTVTAPDGSGMAILGARTVNPPNVQNMDNFPIVQAPLPAGMFSTIPPSANIFSGLTVAPGNDLGAFLFGGTILGEVNIHGSVDLFYTGWLLTGVGVQWDGTTFMGHGGEDNIGIVSDPQNFNVDGDIRNLITRGPIGTEADTRILAPDFVSGFDMHVGGRVGQITSQGSLIGNVDVTNSPSAPNIDGVPTQEIEFRGLAPFDPWDAPLIMLGGDGVPFLNNDTFDTPQYLGPTDSSGDAVVNGIIQASPPIPGPDFVDYYAVPLMAGQKVVVQLTETLGTNNLDAGVFDPDGRLIATDYSRVDPLQTQEQPFQFTADRPGVYRIAVAETSNNNFDANGGPGTHVLADFPYSLSLSGLGNLAIGGIVCAGNILENPGGAVLVAPPNGNGAPVITGAVETNSFHAANGDFGAAVAGAFGVPVDGGYVLANFGDAAVGQFTFAVDNGNLRTVQGTQIGHLTGGNAIEGDSSVSVPHGSVGLLRATDPAGVLAWNVFVGNGITPSQAESATTGIGGDYQLVDAAGLLIADLVAKGSIGTIRAARLTTTPTSYFQVNASYDPNRPGTIDLIDVTGDFGTPGPGGPGIVTGPGGNVRYIHVGGTVVSDIAFGIGTPTTTPYQPGETADITDDSGTVVHLTPVATAAGPASLTVTTYPIRGSGGAAIVRVVSSGGLSVAADGNGPGQTAEIGTIELDGAGTAVLNNNTIQPGNNPGAGGGGGGTAAIVTTRRRNRGHARPPRHHAPPVHPVRAAHPRPARRHGRAQSFPGPGQPGGAPPAGGATGTVGAPGGPPAPVSKNKFTLPTLPTPPSLPANATPLTLSLGSNLNNTVKIDVFEITGPTMGDGSLVPGLGQVTSLTDNTPGEIVNIHLNSLGTLASNGTVGLAASHTASAVLGQVHNPLSEDSAPGNPWDYPFLQPRNMIRVLGNIISISALRGIGNVYAGVINNTGDTVPLVGTPEVPAGGAITSGVNGNIGSINAQILGPVVAAGSIGSDTSPHGFGPNGTGAVGGDGLYAVGMIGPVVSNGDFHGTTVSTTGQLSVTINGVVTQAEIANYSRFDFAEPRALSFVSPPVRTPITFPTVDIGSIAVTGNGGIIGTDITGDHIGPITVGDRGFGIVDSLINVQAEGTLASLTTGGYGFRLSTILGGASIGPINVHGDGSTVPTTGFPASVRQSETGALFDPGTGIVISPLNDIDTYLGTVSAPHQTPGISDTGVIEDSTIRGTRDLNSVSAWSIRGRNLPGGVQVPDPNFHPVFNVNSSTFNLGNKIGLINVAGPVRGLSVTTGRGFRYHFGGDVAGLNMTIAGPIQTLVFNNSLLSDSFINASGPNGRIGSLTIHGNLNGGVRSTQKIGRVQIDGNLVGNITAPFLNMLKLGGGIDNGSLTINTSVGTIQTVGDFGVAGSSLTINGSLGTLKVGRNLNGMLTVLHNLRNMTVNGSILTGAKVAIGGTLGLLKVGGDVQAGATVHAQIIKKQVIKGRVLGTIIAP